MAKIERKKPKRVVTKIGDIFRVEFPDNTKAYFQYIAKDMTQLNSSVIRAFYTHYPIDQDVKIEEIVKDRVDFYAHTILRAGIDFDNWYKIGKSSDIGENELYKIIFCNSSTAYKLYTDGIEFPRASPFYKWCIWTINNEMIKVVDTPYHIKGMIEQGSVEPHIEIFQRMWQGYYKYTCLENEVIKRYPRPEVLSYLKRVDGDKITYICFKGNDFERGVVMESDSLVRISVDEDNPAYKELLNGKFSDTNWKYREFITEEEFNQVWNAVD